MGWSMDWQSYLHLCGSPGIPVIGDNIDRQGASIAVEAEKESLCLLKLSSPELHNSHAAAWQGQLPESV